jgi:hypothetical protein
VVLAFKMGVREVTPAKTTVWEYAAPSGAQVHSVQPLPGDLFLVGESHADGTALLLEMDRAGKVGQRVVFKDGGTAHDQLREVRKTAAGTYLVTQQRAGGKALELDATGNVLRTFACGRFVAIRLPDGNTLVACGDDHRIIEVDPHDNVVWEVGQNDIPGNPLQFVAGLQRLPNGNTVVCNWAGHSKADLPQIFEITRDKKVVWQAKDPRFGWVSSVEILDPSAAGTGGVLR